ncbi:MAG: class I SAM-dependent methyltransferase [Saprospiraceae bacterium]
MRPAFDTIASEYDKSFTHTALGRLLRERVWQILGDLEIRRFEDLKMNFQNNQITKSTNHQALELNCGTGEDALWLARQGWQVLATDVSPEMVEVARAKAAIQLSESWKLSESSSGERHLQFQVCSFAEIGRFEGQQFDLVFSNFGGLNCASPEDLKKLSLDLQKLIAPGGQFVAVVMSRFCWQETLYFLLKGKPREAFRRLSRKPVNARLDEPTTVPTWYFSPNEFQSLFQTKDQKPKTKGRVWPVGFWLPPSYLNPFFEKYPRLLGFLNFLEKNFAPTWLASAADHFLICFEKAKP